jgi:hypothetical protein
MLTQSQAKYLLELPKSLIEKGKYLKQKTYYPVFPIRDRFYMASEQETDFTFFLEIFQSSKNHLRLSLHFQEDETSIGLLRIDFNHRHPNPVEINEHVPEIFKPYAGQWVETSHIHYFIEGYKPLTWAIPLTDDDTFPIKQFADEVEFDDILKAFGQKVNLQTKLLLKYGTKALWNKSKNL